MRPRLAGHELRRLCEEVGARLLIVDPSAAAYGSNENSRALVRAFVSDFDAWARDNNCAILILVAPAEVGRRLLRLDRLGGQRPVHVDPPEGGGRASA